MLSRNLEEIQRLSHWDSRLDELSQIIEKLPSKEDKLLAGILVTLLKHDNLALILEEGKERRRK